MKYNAINKMGLLKVGLGLLVACLISSCSHSSTKQINAGATTLNSSACSGNRYLQKFNCSLDRVETAAQDGDPDAQYALGYMYYYGIGTVRDTTTATLWIRRSAAQGQPVAKKALALITGGAEISTLHRHDTKVSHMNSVAPAKPLHEVLPNYKKANTRSRGYEGAPPLSKRRTRQSAPRLLGATKPVIVSRRGATYQPAVGVARAAMEARLLQTSPTHFTLQLMGSRDLHAIDKFIARNHLQKTARYYQVKYKGNAWYRVVYGDYKTSSQAHVALHNLPATLRAQHPWVKSYRSVQKEIKMH